MKICELGALVDNIKEQIASGKNRSVVIDTEINKLVVAGYNSAFFRHHFSSVIPK